MQKQNTHTNTNMSTSSNQTTLSPCSGMEIERINKDMQLILYSPGIWVIHSEGRYITDIRMQTTK